MAGLTPKRLEGYRSLIFGVLCITGSVSVVIVALYLAGVEGVTAVTGYAGTLAASGAGGFGLSKIGEGIGKKTGG